MPVDTTERRQRNRHQRAQKQEIRISYASGGGMRQFATVEVVDHTAQGLGIRMGVPLAVGQWVTLRAEGQATGSLKDLAGRAIVQWCRSAGSGWYRIGLQYADPKEESPAEEQEACPEAEAAPGGSPDLTGGEDLYEILQVNPKASLDTIHRVYRLLAHRLHPDNQETGNSDEFRRLTAAYQVLSDPEKRAAYDLHRAPEQARLRLFTRESGVHGAAAERRKRQGILAALYQRRLQNPRLPELTVFELEDVLEVAREHLEFSLWYLKERGFVARTDNNQYRITVAGVEEAERLELESLPQDRLLPAPAV
jgi:hypothetical protein